MQPESASVPNPASSGVLPSCEDNPYARKSTHDGKDESHIGHAPDALQAEVDGLGKNPEVNHTHRPNSAHDMSDPSIKPMYSKSHASSTAILPSPLPLPKDGRSDTGDMSHDKSHGLHARLAKAIPAMPTHVDPLTGGFQAFANKKDIPGPVMPASDVEKPVTHNGKGKGIPATKHAINVPSNEPHASEDTAVDECIGKSPDEKKRKLREKGPYDTVSEEEFDQKILDQLIMENPSKMPKHDHVTCQVHVAVHGQCMYTHAFTKPVTAAQLSTSMSGMQMMDQPIRVSTGMGTQIPLNSEIKDGHYILLEENQHVQPSRCPLHAGPMHVVPSIKNVTRAQALWMQKGWVAPDEMEFYMSMLEAYQPSSTGHVVQIPHADDREAMLTFHLQNLIHATHADVNCSMKVMVLLHANHWTPCAVEAKEGSTVIHVPDADYTWVVQGYTSIAGDDEVTFEMHPISHAFDADCGFQAVGWMLSRLMDDDSDMPFTARQACQWRCLFNQNLQYTGQADVMLTDPLQLGGMASVKDQLQQLVTSHGVHADRGSECADQLLTALGTKVIQQILVSPKPWADLKARANMHQPPIRVVLAEELKQQITKRSQEHQQIGKKANKTKGPKQPKNKVRLTADQLVIPHAVFRQEDGHEVAQIAPNQVGPSAQGVVLMNVEEAIPYFGLNAAVSQFGVALLILDHDDVRVPNSCPIVKVPARCIATEER